MFERDAWWWRRGGAWLGEVEGVGEETWVWRTPARMRLGQRPGRGEPHVFQRSARAAEGRLCDGG